MRTQIVIGFIVIVIIIGGIIVFMDDSNNEGLSSSDSNIESFGFGDEFEENQNTAPEAESQTSESNAAAGVSSRSDTAVVTERVSRREVQTTDGVRHSIPLNEVLGGGPGKDGIPSIDNPRFERASASDLSRDNIGIGLNYKGEKRFYPFEILVWHEIVNDTVSGDPLLVSYCPLCQTGIVFMRRVNGEAQEFGVSGNLWKSNLLMYNRAAREEDESIWSQVLGEAVIGPETGTVLPIVSSDIVKWGDWKERHPDTVVLRRPTGVLRPYGVDPYGDYYTNRDVSFGAGSEDLRGLHPKTFTHGIDVNGVFKAYVTDELPVGEMEDTVGGTQITVTKSDIGEVSFVQGGSQIQAVAGFWFSWVEVHPETELWQGN